MTTCLNSVTLQSVEALHFKVLNFKALNQKTGKGPLPGAGARENTIFKEDTQMIIKVMMLLLFFILMVGIGFYCRQTATDVNGFVLGGRSVGPWLTAPQLSSSGTQASSAGNTASLPHGPESETL